MSTIKNSIAALACSSIILALPGCGIISGYKETNERFTEAKERAEQARQTLDASSTDGAIMRMSRPRIAGEEIRLAHNVLPEVFRTRVTYQTLGAQSLEEVTRTVSGLVGMPIRLFESLDGSQNGMPQAGASFSNGTVTFQMRGTFQEFLDEVTAALDLSWRFNAKERQVELYRYETKAISVMLPPGEKKISANINLNSGGGSGGAQSGNVSVDHDVQVNPWKSIMEGVQSILHAEAGTSNGSGAGGGESISVQGRHGTATANPELGLVTVRARPQFVQRVAEYLETINKRFANNVLIDVKVLEVSMDNTAAAGMSFSALKERLGEYALSVVSSDIIQPVSGIPGRITLDTTSKDGSFVTNTVVDALSKVGKVALQSQGQIIAINGQPAPFQQVRELNYIASSSTTIVPDAGTQTTVQPGTKMVGFTANFMPLVLGDNRILLQYQMQISSLLSMTQINSGGNITQLPEIASQSLQQQAFLDDGQTIMLFGFEQAKASDNQGAGMFSISKSTNSNRNMTVVLIQVRTAVQNATAEVVRGVSHG